MIRRPLWNRGGGVFVEEAAGSVPVERRPPADLAEDGEPTPAVRMAHPADRAPAGTSGEPGRQRGREPKRRGASPRNDGLRARPTWLGILTVREE